jgi:CheY-like chemotaxis protein
VAANGIDAVESFRQSHHGVLLMDLKMPLMDGQTAFYKIRDLCDEKGWEMPAVIFCTGFVPSNNVRLLAASGPNYDLIQKPVTSEILLNAVKHHLPAAGSA